VPAAEARVSTVLAAADLDPALPVSVEMTIVAPATALTTLVPDASMLVVGTRGPIALARLALDSVSRAVLDAATVPVLVVPRAPVGSAGDEHRAAGLSEHRLADRTQ
jgi:nucleotide-binding universal stress UspA family protein